MDANCQAFLEHCPFFILASADAEGRCDVSPGAAVPASFEFWTTAIWRGAT